MFTLDDAHPVMTNTLYDHGDVSTRASATIIPSHLYGDAESYLAELSQAEGWTEERRDGLHPQRHVPMVSLARIARAIASSLN